MRTSSLLACCAVAVVLAAAGCGSDRLQTAPDEQPPGEQQYRATATVLESPDHGPELCLGGQMDSYPPQCGGVPITNWDWEAVDDEESASGTTWGVYTVVGTYDGTSITLTEPPRRPQPSDGGPAWEPPTSPCDQPEPATGGASSGPDGVGPAVERVTAEPDHAGLWLTGDVLNVATTGDLDARRAQVREVWGGPLCLVQHERTLAELRAVQEELGSGAAEELGLEMTFSAADEVANVVELGVVAVDDAQRAALDERYGAGTVRVVPGLQPVTR